MEISLFSEHIEGGNSYDLVSRFVLRMDFPHTTGLRIGYTLLDSAKVQGEGKIMTHWMVPRVIQTMRKGPVLLNAVLGNVTEQQALELRDGPEGWNVAETLAHMLNYERTATDRANRILTETNPAFVQMPSMAPGLEYRGMADEIIRLRLDLVKRMMGLADEDWQRTCVHPRFGQMSLLETGLIIGQHDTDHIEQLARIVGLAEALPSA